jgi:ElaB/YqjD/DUF883 family membrane-anchored ribosome-binding protein
MTPRDRQAKQQEKAAQEAGEEAARRTADRTGVGEKKSDPDAVRRDIEETREELGDTVEALSSKADVKGQVQGKVDERKEAVRQKQEELKGKVSGLGERVSSATPEDVKGAATRAATAAEERPLPAIAAALVLGVLIGWLIKGR